MNNAGQLISDINLITHTPSVNRNFSNNARYISIISKIDSLTQCEKKLLLLFMRLADDQQGLLRVANEWLAVKVGCHPKTISRGLKVLMGHDFLRRWDFGGPRQYILCDNLKDSSLSEYVQETILDTTRIREREIKVENAAQEEAPEEPKSQMVDSYIAPYVNSITLVTLSFGEKYQLSQFSQPVIAKALRILGKMPAEKHTFHYLRGICRRRAGNNGERPYKKQYRFESDNCGNVQRISLAEEKYDNAVIDFWSARHFMENHTSGSDFHDAVRRNEVDLPISAEMKEGAAQEVVNINKNGMSVLEWDDEYAKDCVWQPLKPQPEFVRNEAWIKEAKSYRDEVDIENMIKVHSYPESDQFYSDEADRMINNHKMWLYESQLQQNQVIFELEEGYETDYETNTE